MKRSKFNRLSIIIFFLLLLMIVNSCQLDKSPVSNQANQEQKYKLYGQVLKNGGNKNQPVDNVIVLLKNINKKDTTDNEGSFVFTGLREDTYILFTLHPLFNSKEIIFHLQCDTVININLEPIKGDYYPLKLSNKWVYDYLYTSSWDGGNYGDKKIGKETWIVTQKNGNGNGSIYGILIIFNGISIRGENLWSQPQIDTTFFKNDTSYIEIEEKEDSTIIIKRKDPFNSNYIMKEMNRYNPITEGDTLKVGHWGGFAKYVRDVGLSYYEWQNIANYHIFIQSKLIDYSLKE